MSRKQRSNVALWIAVLVVALPASAFAQAPTLTDPTATAATSSETPAVPTAPQPAAAAAPAADQNAAAQNAAVPANAKDAMQVLDQGPIHEAFAEPIVMDPAARVTVDHEPPAPINEIPPDVKPEGKNVQWIPGYWMWSADKKDFIWISGVWRDIPPGRRWVPGHWGKTDAGFQWSPGFWADEQRQEVQMLPLPPASLEVGPSSPAPADNFFWVPGIWMWQSGNYAWRPGYWYAGQANWIWVPDYYCYTPFGAIYVNGYWDYPLASRGLLYAPVWWSSPVYGYTGFYYQPYSAINSALLLSALFINGNYHHYYYGYGNWWNGGVWGNNGFYPWWAWNSRGRGYDPFFAYHHWHDGRNRSDWVNNVRQDFNRHQQQFADHRGQFINAGANNGGPNHGGHGNQHFNQLIKPADQLARDNRNLVLKQLDPKERKVALDQVHDWQRMREARTAAENHAAKNGGVSIVGNQNAQDILRNGTRDRTGNQLAGKLGADANAGAPAVNGQPRLRVDAPNGPRAVFHLPPSKNVGAAGGNQVATGAGQQGQGSPNQNQVKQANQADQMQKLREQLNSRFGGNRGGDNSQVDSALRQFNRGVVQQPKANGQPGGNPFVPRGFRAGDNGATTSGANAGGANSDRGNVTGGANNAAGPQVFRAARPQIDFTGPRPQFDNGAAGQPSGDANPFRGGGQTNFGRFGNSQAGSVDAATQIFRGNVGGNSNLDTRGFHMPSGAERSGSRFPPSGGGTVQLPSRNLDFQNLRGGDAGGAFRSFNGGGAWNRGAVGGGTSGPAVQAAPQFHHPGGAISGAIGAGGGGSGSLDHRRDRH
jgi:hypothetical protein